MKPKQKIDIIWWKKASFYFFAGAVLIVDVLVLAFVFPSQVGQILNHWQKIFSTTNDVAVLTYVSNILAAQDNKTVEAYKDRARAALPDEKKSAGFISGFTKFAARYGVAVKSLSFSPGLISTSSAATGFLKTNTSGEVEVFGNVKGIPADLIVSADAASLKVFLNALNKASQLVGVTTVYYTSLGKNDATTNISLLIYYQPTQFSAKEWKRVKPLTSDDMTFLQGLPKSDQFTLQSE